MVDSLQWEGFREGVDDVRYVTLLQNLLGEAEERSAHNEEAREVRAWLADLDLGQDLDEVRADLCQKILQLREILKP